MDRLEAMRVAVLVMRTRSFTEAARGLKVSPSQASKLVRQLEEEFGAKLFTRSSRSVAPTAIGEAVHAQMASLVEQYDALREEILGRRQSISGDLKIAVSTSLAPSGLIEILARFALQHAGVRVELIRATRAEENLATGSDLAFVSRSELEDSGLFATPIAHFAQRLCAAPSYLAANAPPASAAELSGHVCLFDDTTPETRHWWVDPATPRYRAHGALHSNALLVLRIWCLEGVGIAMLPEFACREELKAGSLVELLPHPARPRLTLYALYPERRLRPVRVALCVDYVKAAIGGA